MKLILKKIKIFIFFAVLSNIAIIAQEEQGGFTIPTVVMPSPDAASLGSFAEFPVGHYTGTVNVSIPIYTIQSGDLQLPISASYNTTGIKVNQEASWIGLGWNLNAGGVITRVIRDKDDLGGNHGTGRLYNWNLPPTNDFEPYMTNTCVTIHNGGQELMDLLQQSEQNFADTEPDSFYFNFGNHSGQFLLPPNNTGQRSLENYHPIMIGESNLDIKLIPKPNRSGHYNFEITDIDGTKYYFGTSESSASVSFIDSRNMPKYDPKKFSYQFELDKIENGEVPFSASTWHLDSIVSVKKDKIRFQYGNRSFTASRNSMSFIMERPLGPVFTTNNVPIGKTGYCKNVYSGSVNENLYLKKITFQNGELEFKTSERFDLQDISGEIGGSGGDPLQLDKIIVRETYNGTKIQEIDFALSYFNPQDPSSIGGEDWFILSRLKLDSIIIRDSKSMITKPYIFTYNNGDLPSKESLAMDHWGYYNGSFNSHLLPRKGFNGIDYNLSNGADREVNPKTLAAGSLKRVQYPTGGTTEFELGPNSYEIQQKLVPVSTFKKRLSSNQFQPAEKDRLAFAFYVAKDSIEIDWRVDLAYLDADPPCETKQWFLPEDEAGYVFSGIAENIEIEDYYPEQEISTPEEETYFDITDQNILFAIDDTFENRQNIVSHQIPDNIEELCEGAQSYSTLFLKKGWHIFYASKANNGFNGLYLQAELEYPDKFELRNVYKYGPGLRVQKQTKTGGGSDEVTTYKYETFDEDNKPIPQGKLLSKPAYHTTYNMETIIPDGPNDHKRVHQLSSNSLQGLGSIENKGLLGYSEVTVQKEGNGRSTYRYYNYTLSSEFATIYHSGIPRNMPARNGKIVLERHMNNNNQLISEKKYQYQYFLRGTVDGIRFINRNALQERHWFTEDSYLLDAYESCGSDVFSGLGDVDAAYRLTTEGYYFKRYRIFSEVEIPRRVTEKLYYPSTNKFSSKETKYEYNDQYLLPVKTTTNMKLSNGSRYQDIIFNKYPFMYSLSDTTNTISQMASRHHHLIGSVIERQYWRKNVGENAKFIASKLTEYNSNFLPEKLYSLNTKDFSTQPNLPQKDDTFSSVFTNGWSYTNEISLKYDNDKNLKEVAQLEKPPSKYYWGYNNSYPVVKADILLADLDASVDSTINLPSGYSSLESLLEDLNDIAINNAKQVLWKSYNSKLRSSLSNAMITTYTYKPLVGITSITDPKGYTMYYHYDEFNRLEFVKDADGNLVSENKYNYKN